MPCCSEAAKKKNSPSSHHNRSWSTNLGTGGPVISSNSEEPVKVQRRTDDHRRGSPGEPGEVSPRFLTIFQRNLAKKYKSRRENHEIREKHEMKKRRGTTEHTERDSESQFGITFVTRCVSADFQFPSSFSSVCSVYSVVHYSFAFPRQKSSGGRKPRRHFPSGITSYLAPFSVHDVTWIAPCREWHA